MYKLLPKTWSIEDRNFWTSPLQIGSVVYTILLIDTNIPYLKSVLTLQMQARTVSFTVLNSMIYLGAFIV